MNIAVITGASSGLGREYCAELAKTRADLDEIWLIARREDAMREVVASLDDKPQHFRFFAMDLADPISYRELENLLKQEAPSVRALICNAGCGRLGNIEDEKWEDQIRQTNLNVTALTAVTALFLPYMPRKVEKGEIAPIILPICSIASFCPNPRMTVYSSTKAYVLSYAKGLSFELRGTAIHVLCVCPGPMRTEFLATAGIGKGSSKTFDTLPYTAPSRVAANSLRIARRRGGIYTPRLFFKFYRLLAKFLPHGLMMHASKT